MTMEQPKKPTGGAYGQYLAENRAAFAKEVVGKPASEVSKIAGIRFKEISSEEKAKYQKKFEEAQKQYAIDMEAFLKAGGEKKQPKRKLKDDGGKASKKQKKDPEAPKRPVGGAYGCFMAKMRPQLQKECEGKPITAIAKLGAERWKQLSDKERTPFEDEYKANKENYDEAMKNYQPPVATAEEGAESKDVKSAERARKKEDKAAAKDAAKAEKTAAKAEKTAAKAAAKAEKATAKVKTSPKAKAAGRGRGKKGQPAAVEIQAAVKAKADQAGYLGTLQKLASIPEIITSGKSQAAMLKALEVSGGLLHPARRALLGGA